MFMRSNAVPGTKYFVMNYMFQLPSQMWVVRPDGTQVLIGYGIGDIIGVISPAVETLQAKSEEVDFVELADGSKLLKPQVWPTVRRVYHLPEPYVNRVYQK